MNVVITGTSRGIGHELTRRALDHGHRVLAVARDPGACKSLGGKLETLALDLKHPEAAAKIADAVKGWECVDILINNAGIMKTGTATEDFLASFHVNTVVPFQTTTALVPSPTPLPSPPLLPIQLSPQRSSCTCELRLLDRTPSSARHT